MSKVLLKYVPETAIPLMTEWLKEYQLHFKISKSRQTKLGDFRPAFNGKPPRISVNGDLNPFHFLITFTHEVAHAAVWKEHKRKVLPHGKEWQSTYSKMLKQMEQEVKFPKAIQEAMKNHLSRPKASTCSDPDFYKVLRQFDKGNPSLFLEDLNEGELFTIHKKRLFKKGKKRRTRFECIDQQNGRTYFVSAHAEIERLTDRKI